MTAVTDLLAKWDAAIPWNCHDWTIPGWSLAECREKLRAAIVADAAVASNGAMKDNAPAFIAGAIVRYSDGETALMRIDEWAANGRAYGRQCMGGTVGCWSQDMRTASVRDFATWKKYNPLSTDKVDELIATLESKGLGWSLDHTGILIEARIWDWLNVIGRYRPATVEPLHDMLMKALAEVKL